MKNEIENGMKNEIVNDMEPNMKMVETMTYTMKWKMRKLTWE